VDTLEAIFSRRSRRNFHDRVVEPEKLAILLKAAMYAPSAMNEQPWQFIVIDDRTLFEQIMHVYPYAGMLASAPLAILVCGDLSLEKAPGNWVLDCSCASQNLLLAAHAIGLGAVWSGIYPEQDRMRALSAMLKLPERVLPLALIAVGYAVGEVPAAPKRFSPDRVRLNDWHNMYRIQGA
jgi:nitroreductase